MKPDAAIRTIREWIQRGHPPQPGEPQRPQRSRRFAEVSSPLSATADPTRKVLQEARAPALTCVGEWFGRAWAQARSSFAVGTSIVVTSLLAAGCGGADVPPREALARNVARALPPGWRIAPADEAPDGLAVPPGPEDLVVWRIEPVDLQPRRGQPESPTEGTLHFNLREVPYLEPAERREAWVENERLRRQHQQLDASVANLARDADGEFISRGVYETAAINEYRRAKAALTPVREDIPEYHYQGLGLRLIDTRAQLVPADRRQQTEMNTAFAAITRVLEAYGR